MLQIYNKFNLSNKPNEECITYGALMLIKENQYTENQQQSQNQRLPPDWLPINTSAFQIFTLQP